MLTQSNIKHIRMLDLLTKMYFIFHEIDQFESSPVFNKWMTKSEKAYEK